MDITPGTVVIYTGSFTDHHGPAIYVGPSGNYPPGDEVRYTLVFVGHPRLEGVGARSFTMPGPDVEIPAEVRDLADAIRNLNRDTFGERIRSDAAKTQAFAMIRNPERDRRLRTERIERASRRLDATINQAEAARRAKES